MLWETLWEVFWGGLLACVLVFGLLYSMTRKSENKGPACPWVCSACGRCRRPQQINDAYRKDAASALERYVGQEMEFTGTVASCTRNFGEKNNLWGIRINAADIDVIGYFREVFPVGREITMLGTCSGLRSDSRVIVVLDSAAVR